MVKETNKTKEETKEGIKEIVEVPKEVLSNLNEELEKLKKDRDILMATIDKKALANYYSRNQGQTALVVKIRKIDGKAIVGWRTVEDLGSYQVPGTGRWTEKQVIELLFEDGSRTKMDYLDFVRKYEIIKATVKETIQESGTGKTIFKVIRNDNNEQITIGSTYVN